MGTFGLPDVWPEVQPVIWPDLWVGQTFVLTLRLGIPLLPVVLPGIVGYDVDTLVIKILDQSGH